MAIQLWVWLTVVGLPASGRGLGAPAALTAHRSPMVPPTHPNMENIPVSNLNSRWRRA